MLSYLPGKVDYVSTCFILACRGRWTLASEKLQERHRIEIHPETLRLWLRQARLPYKQRKARPHRQWRPRRSCFGEMVQLDGSHHDWLEGRGPKLVLMGYIDDATSTVEARFYDHEGTMPALDSFRGWVQRYGIPCSVYLDKHTTYRSPQTPTVEEQLQGHEQSQSQFQRAMSELGVEVIHAHSPAAKGRDRAVVSDPAGPSGQGTTSGWGFDAVGGQPGSGTLSAAAQSAFPARSGSAHGPASSGTVSDWILIRCFA